MAKSWRVRPQDDFRAWETLGAYCHYLVENGVCESMSDAKRRASRVIKKEHHYQKKILEMLRAEFPEGRWRKNAAGIGQASGEPDVDGVLNGRFIAIECKRPLIYRESELQRKAVREINEAGGLAMFATYPDEVYEAIICYMGTEGNNE